MTKKEIERKKEIARMYYMQGLSQKEIAGKVEASEQSVSRWADEGKWATLRAGNNITRPELVNKALAALNMILDQVYQSKDVELIAALPDKLAKFASAIDKLDRKANIVGVIEAFIAFSQWLQQRAADDDMLTPDTLKAINHYQNIYINEHIKI